MWLYVSLFCLCVCMGTYLVETMSWNFRLLMMGGVLPETC